MIVRVSQSTHLGIFHRVCEVTTLLLKRVCGRTSAPISVCGKGLYLSLETTTTHTGYMRASTSLPQCVCVSVSVWSTHVNWGVWGSCEVWCLLPRWTDAPLIRLRRLERNHSRCLRSGPADRCEVCVREACGDHTHSPTLSLPLHLLIHLSFHLPIPQFISLSLNTFIHTSIPSFFSPSTYPIFVHLSSTYLVIHLFIHSSIWPPMGTSSSVSIRPVNKTMSTSLCSMSYRASFYMCFHPIITIPSPQCLVPTRNEEVWC